MRISKKYRIGSLNLNKIGRNSKKKDIDKICQIIRDNKIDILAIQEIFHKDALDSILESLNKSKRTWAGRWDTPNSRSVSAAEGYAFIWNTQRVELSKRKSKTTSETTSETSSEIPFEPVIHNQYPHRGGALIRNPYYGRFQLVSNGEVELRILNTHIMFSQNRTINDSDDKDSCIQHYSDVELRKREFEILASKILPKIDDKTYDYYFHEHDDTCRKPYTILMGDYNLNLKESGAGSPYLSHLADESIIILGEGTHAEKRIITVQKDLTTLKAKKSDGTPTQGFSNNYDHFTYDRNHLNQLYVHCWAVTDAIDKYFDGDFDKYREGVSDHLMVIIEIGF